MSVGLYMICNKNLLFQEEKDGMFSYDQTMEWSLCLKDSSGEWDKDTCNPVLAKVLPYGE